MEKIKDNEVKLVKVEVNVNTDYVEYHSQQVKAKLQVHYHLEEVPQITCNIEVVRDDDYSLFHLTLEYQVPKMEQETQNQYIDQIGMLIKPRIEDLINYIIGETGHIEQ